MNKNLECSSRGDRRFSALYAQVTIFGITNSIENHYQQIKRSRMGERVRKGQYVDHVIINGLKLYPNALTPYYTYLWVQYLDANPNLVEYASKFDTFSDMFKGRAINCQADVIRTYIKEGRGFIMNDPDVQAIANLMKVRR